MVCDEKVRIYDPVAGGAALVVIDVGSTVDALAVFKDPATGEPRLACGCSCDEKVRIFRPGRRWRGAARARGGLFGARAGGLRGPGDGRAAAARSGSGEKVRVFDPVAGGEALVVLDVGTKVRALAVFHGPGDGRAARVRAIRERRCLSSTRSRAATRCSC